MSEEKKPSPELKPVGIPEGWKLVPRTPTDAMMEAGLYQASHDAEWSDIYSSWVDMVNASPEPEGVPEPETATGLCAACGFEKAEHHHDGACYGVCGKFVDPSPRMREMGND